MAIEHLGKRELLVIGAGPTGLSALWFARSHGIDAIAIDAGASELGALRAFAPGLVTASNPLEWEIDGLPVDCRDPGEVTREDLLSYYGRVAAYGALRVVTKQAVTAIVPGVHEARVDVFTEKGPAYWTARRVLVTPWFRRRKLASMTGGITVLDSLVEGASFRGEHVVVFGGGLSGLETADLLVRAGTRVTVLSRRGDPLPPSLTRLFEVSGSRLITRVESTDVVRRQTLRVKHADGQEDVACSVAINCAGHEINRALIRALHKSSLLSDPERSTLESFQQATVLDPGPIEQRATRLPALADALWAGRRGVHFAGTVFHVGGVLGGGIKYSIETAKWAVQSIAGVEPDGAPDAATHLPAWFATRPRGNVSPKRGPRWCRHVMDIVPVPIPTWSRGTKLLDREDENAAPGLAATCDSRALNGARSGDLTLLRRECYRGASVAELQALLSMDPQALLRSLARLWFNNGLSWLPPGLAQREFVRTVSAPPTSMPRELDETLDSDPLHRTG